MGNTFSEDAEMCTSCQCMRDQSNTAPEMTSGFRGAPSEGLVEVLRPQQAQLNLRRGVRSVAVTDTSEVRYPD